MTKVKNTNLLLTVAQAAVELQVNKNFVYLLIKTGELKAILLGTWKITRKELESFLERLEKKTRCS